MPIRKSIRDVQTSNTISDIIPPEPVKTNIVKNKKIEKIIEPSQLVQEYTQDETFSSVETVTPPQSLSSNKKSKYKMMLKSFSQIKTMYIVAFGIIFLGLIVLIFIPSSEPKDPAEQTRKEAEIVKKQFATHIILPENEQIDIRKITNKMEDPFFKDAEVGDYLIIFYKNRIAYIYSIDKDIIVNAGVVFIDPKTATTTNSTTKTQ
jgi:hypothetical protein